MRTEIQNQDHNLVIAELKDLRKKKSIYNLKSISNNYTTYLKHHYMSGNAMMSTVILINYLTNLEKNRKTLFSRISKWFSNPIKLNVDSTQSIIYLMELQNSSEKIIDIILKIDKKTIEKNSYREYFLAFTQINRLRYILPNFMMTYGQFKCIKPSESNETIYFNKLCKPKGNYVNYTLYERIVGISFENYLTSYDLKYNEFLKCFIQILFALEKSQEECGFTHFDLHYDNIILRSVNNKTFEIYSNGLKYKIKTGKYVPVLIDYGHACVKKYNGKTYRYIGYGDFPEHGMMNFMIPGYDMYKIMYFCIYKLSKNLLKENLQKLKSESQKILNMLRQIFLFFYGKSEPYSIFKRNKVNKENLDKCMEEYGKMATYSSIANKTPIQLIKFLIDSNIINIDKSFQVNPVPFQRDKSSLNIITKYMIVDVIQPKCNILYKNNNLLSLKKYIEIITNLVESDNDIHEHIMLSLINFIENIKATDYSEDIKLIKKLPINLELLDILCEKNKFILNVILEKGINKKLDFKQWKHLKKIYEQTQNLFQLYYMIKYNYIHHKSNIIESVKWGLYNPIIPSSLENKWNQLSILSQQILRWYDSIIYYQFTKYNNNRGINNIFNNDYFEQFDIFIVQKNIKTPWKFGNLF